MGELTSFPHPHVCHCVPHLKKKKRLIGKDLPETQEAKSKYRKIDSIKPRRFCTAKQAFDKEATDKAGENICK